MSDPINDPVEVTEQAVRQTTTTIVEVPTLPETGSETDILTIGAGFLILGTVLKRIGR